jgi:hypothetical protein
MRVARTERKACGPLWPQNAPNTTPVDRVADAVVPTPRSIGKEFKAQRVDVAKPLNRCMTPSSGQMPNLRQVHDRRQRGQKGTGGGEGIIGHSEGSREVPMVRTPADPLGSRTPSRGRSQRRDTGRGSHQRSAAHTCVKAINKQCKRQGNRRFPDD